MFLDQIVAATRQRLAALQGHISKLEAAIWANRPPRDFTAALRRRAEDTGTGHPAVKIIAEIKRASPSKGPLNLSLDVAHLAQAYERGGAAALSVLTEPRFFQGSFDDLEAARKATALPILCKDFILEPVQIYEARAHGADAILLIVAILPPAKLRALQELATSLGMAALVEAHNQAEVQQALEAGAQIIGINNRNLVDFKVDIDTTFRLRPVIPANILVVSESGIHFPADIARLRGIGVNAVLIGEALVTSDQPAQKLAELLSGQYQPPPNSD